jgi:hypothetical protein
LIVDEVNLQQLKEGEKIHLIKLAFEEPTTDKVEQVLDRFPSTNRFIISDNIKFYNDVLRSRKKYYVENGNGIGLISFFKKNNKVLLNLQNLTSEERSFVKNNIRDVLRNLEAIYIGSRNSIDDALSEELRY